MYVTALLFFTFDLLITHSMSYIAILSLNCSVSLNRGRSQEMVKKGKKVERKEVVVYCLIQPIPPCPRCTRTDN
jgi:hypothetical protein